MRVYSIWRVFLKREGCSIFEQSTRFKEMSSQSKISNFFTSQPTKRKQEEKLNSPPAKVQKSDERTTKLSPEQEVEVEKKRMAALAKLGTSYGPKTMGCTWKTALAAEFNKDYFKKLMQFVQSERKSHTIYPKESDVYSWTNHCEIDKIKVVIIGQDPYHQPRQAHGLCFSVPAGVPPPPSLVNIYKEIESDVKDFKIPKHGNLTGWARQGVLLLNACLTVRGNQANSHKDKGWETFTDAVIKWINQNLKNVVFLLWGSYAQKKGSFIDKKKHCVLKSVHPSPLSAYRGFLGCKHFSKTNNYLKETEQKSIVWSDIPSDA